METTGLARDIVETTFVNMIVRSKGGAEAIKKIFVHMVFHGWWGHDQERMGGMGLRYINGEPR
jgi:hypothetical protein